MKRIVITLSLLFSIAFTAAAADEGVRLDNGKDLTGWKGDATYWSVEDGALHGQDDGR